MSNEEIAEKLSVLEKKIDAVYVSAEKTRRYFLISMIGGALAFLLPLIALAFVIPFFLSNYLGSLEGLL
ncbi:MAG TPA: hypothetical protein VLB83_04810 [Candidatus Paceibacterota bacterium]|nr:hypothetical protein [Candidatus Paceibacterota bacterium]